MTYDDFKSLCEYRHSIRSFDDKPVSKEDVLALLELACLAPSVENLQPWHFHVIFNPDLRTKLTETSCYGNFVAAGGVFIIVTADRSLKEADQEPLWNPRELEYSCMGAMEHILLGATVMGIGGTWVSLHHGTAHEILELPQNEIVVGGILIGYPDAEEKHKPISHQRKPLKDIYTLHE